MRAVSTLVITTIALAGCSSSSKYDELVVQTIDVFEGPFNTGPIPGVHVQVNDQPWVTTDANGKATFKNVDRPFTVRADLTFTTSGQWDSVGEIQRLDVNPVVLSFTNRHIQSRNAIIAGSVTNRSADAGSIVSVKAAPPFLPAPVPVAADGTFQISLGWDQFLSSTQTLVLHAFESDTANPPTHYSGYASASIPVSDGASVVGVTLALSPVAEIHIAGTVNKATALADLRLIPSLRLVFPDESSVDLPAGPNVLFAPASFDYVVPIVGTNTAEIAFFTNFGPGGTNAFHGRRIDFAQGSAVTGVAFDVPAPVPLLEPAEGAGIGPGTAFRWGAGPAGATYTLGVACELTGSQGVNWVIETTATEATLFSTPFFTLTPGMTCSWSVSWTDAGFLSLFSPGSPRNVRWAEADTRSAVVQ